MHSKILNLISIKILEMKILKILLACKNPTIIRFKKNLEKCEIL